MKIVFWILAGVGVFALIAWMRRPTTPPGMLSQAQKNAGNDATLWAYSVVMPPLAQIDRPPLTNVNLRTVDPVLNIPPYGDTINQNGQTA